MALTLATEYLGLHVPDAYVRVAPGLLTLTPERINFHVHYHVAEGGAVFREASYDAAYDLVGGNPFEQAYLYLRTLPEFHGSTDC